MPYIVNFLTGTGLALLGTPSGISHAEQVSVCNTIAIVTVCENLNKREKRRTRPKKRHAKQGRFQGRRRPLLLPHMQGRDFYFERSFIQGRFMGY